MISTSSNIIISVIIPSYKPIKNFFIECINSIQDQTLPRTYFEILVILNGSEYSHLKMVQEVFENSSVDFHIFQTDEANVSKARNIGLQNSKGKYICFIDDDDVISSDYLESTLRLIKNYSIVATNVKTFISTTNDLEDDYISKAFRKKLKNNNLSQRAFLSSACCKLIPKEIIGERRFNPNVRIGEDSVFMALISNNIHKIILTSPETIYYRRLRSHSVSRIKSSFIDKIKLIFKLFIEYTKIYLSNPKHYNILFFTSRIFALVKKF